MLVAIDFRVAEFFQSKHDGRVVGKLIRLSKDSFIEGALKFVLLWLQQALVALLTYGMVAD